MSRDAQPPLPREVRILVAVAFFVALGFGIVAPALPVFAHDFGVGPAAAGAVISVFAVMRIAFALPTGRLVDRFGERIVLANGIAVVAVSSALAGLSQSYAELIALRGIGGVGSAMFSIGAMSLLVRWCPRPSAAGRWGSARRVPARWHRRPGSRRRRHRHVDPAAVLPVRRRPSSRPGRSRSSPFGRRRWLTRAATNANSRTTLRQAFRDPAYRAALAANFADSWGAIGVRSALIPLFVTDVLHKPFIWTGSASSSCPPPTARLLLPAAHYADRVGRKPVLLAGCIGSGIGIAVLAIWPDLGGYFIGLALLGIGSGLLDVAPGAIVGDVVEGQGRTGLRGVLDVVRSRHCHGPVAAGSRRRLLLCRVRHDPPAFSASRRSSPRSRGRPCIGRPASPKDQSRTSTAGHRRRRRPSWRA